MSVPPVINITDPPYNAVGDGVIDDTSAIQAALNAVPSPPSSPTSGAIVFAPPGVYVVSRSLLRTVSFTRFIGAGKNATVIQIAPNSLENFYSGGPGWVFDLQGGPNDCSVEDLTIDGNTRSQTTKPSDGAAGGVNCSTRECVNRVSLYDIFGWSIWLGGKSSDLARVIDCDADSPAPTQRWPGSDTIGGKGYRNKIVRSHWKPNLTKLDALDLTNGGDGGECSVDLLDCINESALTILLEGCMQATVKGCRFYGNTLKILSDAKYTSHTEITNPRNIIVSRCLFVGSGQDDNGPLPALQVLFDGGSYQVGSPRPTNLGGLISILDNQFLESLISAIQWAGDDFSTSEGGSLIAGNRIVDPNQSDQTGVRSIGGAFESLGSAYAAGIAVMSSYGLSISDNSVADDTNLMPYAMQLARQDAAPPAPVQRILVKGNQCGTAPGVGNGNLGTFFFPPILAVSATNPLPILFLNTNQPSGYDGSPVINNGVPWPPPQGYQYNALVTVAGTAVILIDGHPTGLSSGAFYLSVGQQITVSWGLGSPPTITVFRQA